ncbi:MAG: hypothetical protein KJ638_07555 [Chloroflexi bacterium]|nr:hypothetical protein [Chloroflexota bacterium]
MFIPRYSALVRVQIRLISTKCAVAPVYADWGDRQWQDFALSRFLREEDDVGYSLEDAQEIFRA